MAEKLKVFDAKTVDQWRDEVMREQTDNVNEYD